MKFLVVIVLLAFGTWIIVSHQGVVPMEADEPGLNPRDIPLWIGIAADALSILLFIVDLAGRARRRTKP